MLRIFRISPSVELFSELCRFDDYTIYQTQEWARFVADTQEAEPVWAEVRDGSSVLGYLSGLISRRFKIPVFGSPLPGWTTMYMGFNLLPEVPRWLALQALDRFVFSDLGCLHYEITDRFMTPEDGRQAGVPQPEFLVTKETDIKQSEEDLFGRMEGACRRCIRKALKCGVTVEEVGDDETFAVEFFEQLKTVFKRQRQAPTYDLFRVQKLIEHLRPTGRLLLLRARDSEGRCIATGIYPGLKRISQFWGNASWRWGQILRPNEALHWYAIRYWKKRCAEFFDWGGESDYKDKYGCYRVYVPRFRKSRFAVLGRLRDQYKKMHDYGYQLRSRLAA